MYTPKIFHPMYQRHVNDVEPGGPFSTFFICHPVRFLARGGRSFRNLCGKYSYKLRIPDIGSVDCDNIVSDIYKGASFEIHTVDMKLWVFGISYWTIKLFLYYISHANSRLDYTNLTDVKVFLHYFMPNYDDS